VALLTVESLGKSFGGIHATRDVSFEVEAGRTMGVIGPNGAGKTTLFNLITGFLRPDRGRVTFAGIDVTGMRPDRIARLGMARTFQIAEPMNGLTVAESVRVNAYARPGLTRAEADRAAAQAIGRVGLAAKAGVLSGALTAAERHRLEFARALAAAPKIILLDEIAAGLWPEEQNEIARLIGECTAEEGIAFLIVEHKLAFMIAVAHSVIVLNFGEMIAAGSPAEVLAQPEVMQAYLGSGEGDAATA